MVNVSIREAVKLYDVSRPTLTKHLKNGRISGTQDGKGQWQIAPAELARVYQPRKTKQHENDQRISDSYTTESALELERLKNALVMAETRADAVEGRLLDKDAMISDLREDRDRWRQQATSLLEDKRPKSFFLKLIGR